MLRLCWLPLLAALGCGEEECDALACLDSWTLALGTLADGSYELRVSDEVPEIWVCKFTVAGATATRDDGCDARLAFDADGATVAITFHVTLPVGQTTIALYEDGAQVVATVFTPSLAEVEREEGCATCLQGTDTL